MQAIGMCSAYDKLTQVAFIPMATSIEACALDTLPYLTFQDMRPGFFKLNSALKPATPTHDLGIIKVARKRLSCSINLS
jgi:hypothetical protein